MKAEGIGRRRRQCLNDLRNTKRYRKLKGEAEDKTRWIRKFITWTKGRNHPFTSI